MTANPQPTSSARQHPRLEARWLKDLPSEVRGLSYDRNRIDTGIVHLGIGAFHRAHQAVYLDDLLSKEVEPWGIVGVSLRHSAVRDALEPQDGLYTLVVRHDSRTEYRVIGSVKSVLVAPEDPEAVIRRLAAPSTRLVTLTVTEKGYCLAPDGKIDPALPEIGHDLKTPDRPKSAVGFIVEALRRIRDAETPPPTILSCDNLPSNGRALRQALIDFAARRDEKLANWIERNAAIPSSMIDRIVPATTEADLAEVEAVLTFADWGAVVGEPFSQWVIEDRLGDRFPPLAGVGAEIVPDVGPYERMKLRMLNGCHSSIAYLGQLAGCEYVCDALAEPCLRHFIERMMVEEIAPTLSHFSNGRLNSYGAELMRRFANRAIRHRTWQISMDGSQKLPQRLFATIEDRLRSGASIKRLTLAVAAWIEFLGGKDDRGRPIDVSDPYARDLTRWADVQQSEAQIVANLVDRSGIFPESLRRSERFRRKLVDALALLRRLGAKEALKQYAQNSS